MAVHILGLLRFSKQGQVVQLGLNSTYMGGCLGTPCTTGITWTASYSGHYYDSINIRASSPWHEWFKRGPRYLVTLPLGGITVREGGHQLFDDLELAPEQSVLGHVDLEKDGSAS